MKAIQLIEGTELRQIANRILLWTILRRMRNTLVLGAKRAAFLIQIQMMKAG
jgi:hypothetical protein